MMSSHDTQASIWFLQRLPLYNTEKVYEFKYDPPKGLSKTNMHLEKRDGIPVEDIRDTKSNYLIEEQGFQILELGDSSDSIDYDDETALREKYFPMIATAVKDAMKAERVQIFDYVVSYIVLQC